MQVREQMMVYLLSYLLTVSFTYFHILIAAAAGGGGGGQVVDPWTVESDNAIAYDKLIRDFGSQPLTQDIIDRMEKLTGKKPHRFLR